MNGNFSELVGSVGDIWRLKRNIRRLVAVGVQPSIPVFQFDNLDRTTPLFIGVFAGIRALPSRVREIEQKSTIFSQKLFE